ncbi:MAG: FtsX-like permease family protein [Propionibacteriaceae bacterium]|jgi:putative ABC transport system permease protein|nr:FtsX-like permease family protein [Propionibacteriaceae bacterium]
MLRYSLATMARSGGRLAAGGVAVAIATAFITIALLGNNVVSRTILNSLSAQYAQADLVVLRQTPQGWIEYLPLSAQAAAQVPGVAANHAPYQLWLELAGPSRRELLSASVMAADPALVSAPLVLGQAPRGDRQIVLAADTADRLSLGLGDTVEVCHAVVAPPQAEQPDQTSCQDFQVSGLTATDQSLTGPASVFLSPAVGAAIAADERVQDAPWFSLRLAPGADPAALADTVAAAVARAVDQIEADQKPGAGPSDAVITVMTPDQAATQMLDKQLGDQRVLTGLLLAFAAIALLVASLVIANTFQVLIAQRTRQLALLRCVGADPGQVAGSVLLEAGLTGLISSAAGFGLGCAIGQGALALAGRINPQLQLPAGIELTPVTWVAPLLAGLLVTLAAGLAPARLATRVPPVAALGPLQPADPARPGGRGRLIWSVALVLVGAVGLGVALATSQTTPQAASTGRYFAPLLTGLAGAAVFLVGLLLGACFWLPQLVAGLGRGLERTGPGARLAVANTRRNPGRTTATATALLVGVVLVAAMSTGAASLKRSINGLLDQEMPLDLALMTSSPSFVSSDPDQPIDQFELTVPSIPAGLAQRVAALDGLVASASLPGTAVSLAGASRAAQLVLLGVDPLAAGAVLRDSAMLSGLAGDTVLIAPWLARQQDWQEGERLTVRGTNGDQLELRAQVVSLNGLGTALVSLDNLTQLAPAAPTSQLWFRLADQGDPTATLDDIRRLVDDAGLDSADQPTLDGSAVERARYDQLLDTVAAIAIGLLAVAIVIALIGVANTLSLAVIERRRESALLRALGLTRGQARWMLTVEGIFMAAVAAVSGVVVGVGLAWIGVGVILGTARGQTLLTIDPLQLGLTVAGAILAGALASILPGASVARTPPAQALTTDQL